jgi:hypothetical protein
MTETESVFPGMTERGMSLRDFFAAAAIQGYLAAGNTGGWGWETHASKAYEIADEMLKARKGAEK